MAGRTDIGDAQDPNPNKRQQYQQPDLKSERIEGRSFAGENVAAAERQQRADDRNSGPADRGNRTDDVQASDRGGESARTEGEAGDADRARRVYAARTGLDAERRAETDENL